MAVTWRPAAWKDVESGLSIPRANRGDAVVAGEAALQGWKSLFQDPFFASAVLESNPLSGGHRVVGFGASVLVSAKFAEAEVANPRPHLTSRIVASVCSGESVLATRSEIARANANGGVNVVILTGNWRDEILNAADRQTVKTLLALSFAEWHMGYRIQRIFQETTNELTREFLQHSVVYKAIAEFPELGLSTYLITSESVREVSASLGNVLFDYREPMLRLRDSDQQMLLAALRGATDCEISDALGIGISAVKARWRSTFTRIGSVMPTLIDDLQDRDGRGLQKRHGVLSYIRTHPEELRPYDWKQS